MCTTAAALAAVPPAIEAAAPSIPVPTRVSPQPMPLSTRPQRRAKSAERAQADLAALISRAVRARGRGRPENNPAAWASPTETCGAATSPQA
ncbi:hypothetical protein ACIQVA_34660 [Streptomyces microflavus]|uniref:hypothetical protein n=1 Tax=Streptomyces microflavus TaxID=1919 RepID=UPI0038048FD6